MYPTRLEAHLSLFFFMIFFLSVSVRGGILDLAFGMTFLRCSGKPPVIVTLNATVVHEILTVPHFFFYCKMSKNLAFC